MVDSNDDLGTAKNAIGPPLPTMDSAVALMFLKAHGQYRTPPRPKPCLAVRMPEDVIVRIGEWQNYQDLRIKAGDYLVGVADGSLSVVTAVDMEQWTGAYKVRPPAVKPKGRVRRTRTQIEADRKTATVTPVVPTVTESDPQ
jgi:hypothetical protein